MAVAGEFNGNSALLTERNGLERTPVPRILVRRASPCSSPLLEAQRACLVLVRVPKVTPDRLEVGRGHCRRMGDHCPQGRRESRDLRLPVREQRRRRSRDIFPKILEQLVGTGVLSITVTETELTVTTPKAPETGVYRVERKRRLHSEQAETAFFCDRLDVLSRTCMSRCSSGSLRWRSGFAASKRWDGPEGAFSVIQEWHVEQP